MAIDRQGAVKATSYQRGWARVRGCWGEKKEMVMVRMRPINGDVQDNGEGEDEGEREFRR